MTQEPHAHVLDCALLTTLRLQVETRPLDLPLTRELWRLHLGDQALDLDAEFVLRSAIAEVRQWSTPERRDVLRDSTRSSVPMLSLSARCGPIAEHLDDVIRPLEASDPSSDAQVIVQACVDLSNPVLDLRTPLQRKRGSSEVRVQLLDVHAPLIDPAARLGDLARDRLHVAMALRDLSLVASAVQPTVELFDHLLGSIEPSHQTSDPFLGVFFGLLRRPNSTGEGPTKGFGPFDRVLQLVALFEQGPQLPAVDQTGTVVGSPRSSA